MADGSAPVRFFGRARALASAVGLICLLVLGGCGGGEEPGSRPAASAPSSQSAATGTSASPQRPSTTATAPSQASATASSAATTSASTPHAASGAAAQADTICVRRNQELVGVPIGSGGLAATASAASRRGAIEQRALAELGKLTPPASVAHDWKNLIAASKISLGHVLELAKDASSNDREGASRELAASGGAQLRLLVAAVRTGARHCATIR
jgi:hypothetical protein